jgi:hypothetical protein
VKTSFVFVTSCVLLGSLYACGDDETTANATASSSKQSSSSSTASGMGGSQGGMGEAGAGGQGGSQGGAGGGACRTCNTFLEMCAPGAGMMMGGCEETNLCADSLALWTAYKTCICDAANCADNCAEFCTGMGSNMQCGGCVNNAPCGTQEDACTADM